MPNEENDDLPGEEEIEQPKPPAKKPAAKPAAVSPPPPPPPAEPPKKRHTSRAIAHAKALNFTDEDIESLDPAELWEEIHREASLRRAPEKQAEKKPAPQEPVDEDEEFLKELEQTDVDPKYTKFLRRVVGTNKELRTKLTATEEREKARHDAEITDACESAFEVLAGTHAAQIGTGSHTEIDPGQFGWRAAIFKQAGIDPAKDSPASIKRKLVKTGQEMLAKKGDAASSPPPPPPAEPEKKIPPKDPATGRFTKEQFAESRLPAPERVVDTSKLNGAAVVHQYLAEHGDPRAERPYREDDDSDLPGGG